MINVLQKTCLEAQRCQVKLNKACDRQLILNNKCPYQTFHCLSTICWDFFRTPIKYSKFSFLEERWVAKEFKADSKNYIKQIKRETNFLLLDSKMFVWEKNVPIAVLSFLRKPINTVCTRRLETSWADSLRLPCLWQLLIVRRS